METQTIHGMSVEMRAPYYVGVADLDEMIGLWGRAQDIDAAIDPVMLVASRYTRGHTIITETHRTVLSWISPAGTCFIWELTTAYTEGIMGPTGFGPMDPENYMRRTKRALACAESVKRYLEAHKLYILGSAAVGRPADLVLLRADRPVFLVFNSELNCTQPINYVE